MLVLGIVTVVRSGNHPNEAQTELEERRAAGCRNLWDIWGAPGSEPDPELPEEEWNSTEVLYATECAGPTGAVILVEGLPDVSGVYAKLPAPGAQADSTDATRSQQVQFLERGDRRAAANVEARGWACAHPRARPRAGTGSCSASCPASSVSGHLNWPVWIRCVSDMKRRTSP